MCNHTICIFIHKRLQHIFGEQVFGLAPTEIIYRIATNYILGFDNRGIITKHNFKKADALQFSKDGTLPQMLEELFGDTVEKCSRTKAHAILQQSGVCSQKGCTPRLT